MRRIAVADFRCTGLGAEIESREVVLAVGGDHVVVQHAVEFFCGGFFEQPLLAGLECEVRIPAVGKGDVFDQRRIDGDTAIGDGTHVDHHRAGIDHVVVLPDARPCEREVCGGEVERARSGLDAVEAVLSGDAGLFGVLFQYRGADFQSDVREGAVTGIGERILKALRAVPIRAGDPVGLRIAEGDDFRAGVLIAVQPVERLDRGGRRDDLEDRAGDEGAGNEFVVVGAVHVFAGKVRRIGRIVVGGTDHAEDFAGLVVVDADGAVAACQCAVGGGAGVGIDRQDQMAAVAGDRMRTGQETVADQFVGEDPVGPGRYVADRIPDRMQGGGADVVALVVVGHAGVGVLHQQRLIAVVDRAFAEIAVGVDIPVARVGGPVAAVSGEFINIVAEPHQQDQRQCDAEARTLFHFFHLSAPPLGLFFAERACLARRFLAGVSASRSSQSTTSSTTSSDNLDLERLERLPAYWWVSVKTSL